MSEQTKVDDKKMTAIKTDRNGVAVKVDGTVVHTSQVAHVTFYITEEKGVYRLFSWSEKQGLRQCRIDEAGFDTYEYEEISRTLERETIDLEQILEYKRDGIPTPNQLFFLFREKISIPIDLTWGQASDIIEERLAQKIREKEAKLAERFMGLQVGMRVYQHFKVWYPSGETWQTNKGEITKLTLQTRGLDDWPGDNYAYVRWDDAHFARVSRVTVGTLRREIEGEPLKPTGGTRPPLIPTRYGEKVHHPQYGKGTILHAGETLANVQFQDDKRMVALTELNEPVESNER